MYHKNEIKVLNNKKVEEFAKFINLELPLTYNLKEKRLLVITNFTPYSS